MSFFKKKTRFTSLSPAAKTEHFAPFYATRDYSPQKRIY